MYLQVKATDNGRPQAKNSVRVLIHIVDMPKTSPNPPSILNPNTTVTVMENDPVGQLVMLVEALDEDFDRIWYSITGML